MAIVRNGSGPACSHEPGCPHDIGPAASGFDGLSAMGRLSALRVPGIDTAAVAVGAGPIERRTETAEDRAAREVREALAARPVVVQAHRNAPTGTHPAYRLERAAARAVATVEEAPVTTPAAPPALPCGTCLHEPVCALKALLPSDPEGDVDELAPGLRIRFTAAIECDHRLVSLASVPEPTDRRLAQTPEDFEAAGAIRRHPSKAGERAEKERRAAAALAALERHGGDRRAAAAELGIRGNAFAMIVKHAAGRQAVGA